MTGAEIVARRKALELSQAQLAAKLDVHVQTLSKWERDVQPFDHPAMLDLALKALERTKRRSK